MVVRRLYARVGSPALGGAGVPTVWKLETLYCTAARVAQRREHQRLHRPPTDRTAPQMQLGCMKTRAARALQLAGRRASVPCQLRVLGRCS